MDRVSDKWDFEELLAKGKKQGFLTPEDILKVVPKPEQDLAHLEDIWDALSENGVEILEGDRQGHGLLDNEQSDDDSKTGVAQNLGLPREEEVIDDPVRMYLREIGRVHLLDAVGEKTLARKILEGRHVERFEKNWLEQYGEPPATLDIVGVLLRDIYGAAALIGAVAAEYKLGDAQDITHVLFNPGYRRSIDNELDREMMARVAEKLQVPIEEIEQSIVKLSLDICLIPKDCIEIIAVNLADLNEQSVEPHLDSIQAKLKEHERYFKRKYRR